jgi:hypothetical protein
MGYFKNRKKKRAEKERAIMIDLFTAQTVGTHKTVVQGVLDAIGIFDQKKYEYETNVRENLEQLIHHGDIDKLVEEVAAVIDKQSKVYGYRIAKSKRTELAQDILVALSVKK